MNAATKQRRSVVVKVTQEDHNRAEHWGLRCPLGWAVWRCCRGFFDNCAVGRRLNQKTPDLRVAWVSNWSNRQQATLVLRPRCLGGYTLKLPPRLFRQFSTRDTYSMEERWRQARPTKYPV